MCKRKKKHAKCCNIVTSIVNLILLVVCYILLAVKFPTGCTLDFDYYGVIVGILSLLVTALIGWKLPPLLVGTYTLQLMLKIASKS